jgi:hypothetical protein
LKYVHQIGENLVIYHTWYGGKIKKE